MKSDMKLGPQTLLGAESQSEGTVRLILIAGLTKSIREHLHLDCSLVN